MNMHSPETPEQLEAFLGGEARRGRRVLRWLVVALMLLAAAAVAYFVMQSRRTAAMPRFNTVAVTRGDLNVTVTANGTLQPTRSVSIGSELSGTVAQVLVDVNDQVKKGQLLVQLDTAKLRDQISRSRATLAAAEAKVLQAAATVKEDRANLARLEEVARLSGGKVPSQSDLTTAQAALERAHADEASASADVANAKAALSSDETNLAKASIRSPIDGVVLARTVEPGNAVAASLQAVTLLTLAQDLSKLKLQVNVDEADVARVREGQTAQFTVSGYPNRKYPATITRVAYGSTTTDNVVTYVTYLDVDNADRSLRPGMTATATITATRRENVLLVPNAALRFTPSDAAGAAAPSDSIVSRLMPRPPYASRSRISNKAAKQIWVLQDGQPLAYAVTPGASDGRLTEVTSDTLQANMAVITEQIAGANR